jgi:hypothetical protein
MKVTDETIRRLANASLRYKWDKLVDEPTSPMLTWGKCAFCRAQPKCPTIHSNVVRNNSCPASMLCMMARGTRRSILRAWIVSIPTALTVHFLLVLMADGVYDYVKEI